MKHCPKCRNRYPSENDFCLIDGTTLVSSDPDAETLRIESPPEVPETEMISRKVRVAVGDYFDLTTISGSIRVEVRGIAEHQFANDIVPFITKKESAAQIKVNSGGGLVNGGSSTVSVGTNEYLVPVRESSNREEPRSLYYFHINDGRFTFFKISIEHINSNTSNVDLNLFYLRHVPNL